MGDDKTAKASEPWYKRDGGTFDLVVLGSAIAAGAACMVGSSVVNRSQLEKALYVQKGAVQAILKEMADGKGPGDLTPQERNILGRLESADGKGVETMETGTRDAFGAGSRQAYEGRPGSGLTVYALGGGIVASEINGKHAGLFIPKNLSSPEKKGDVDVSGGAFNVTVSGGTPPAITPEMAWQRVKEIKAQAKNQVKQK